jgi:hypothetical protein
MDTVEEKVVSFINHSDFVQNYAKKHKKELEELRKKLEGFNWKKFYIIGDNGYLKERLQYATTSFEEKLVSPRVIFYPAGIEEVSQAVKLCHQLGFSLAVRTGGHQYCGYSSTTPKNLQLDLSTTFPEYDYDPQKNILKCGVSHALGDWAKKNSEQGIYLPMGVCAHVHLGGHVHTGGWGIVARSHGILADHVLGFDIVLANGDREHIIRPTNETSQHNNDVFYAVLGGGKGGDFGIVTHWEFSPLRDADYPNSACYTFAWLWSKSRMKSVITRMQELSKLCASGQVPSDYEFMLTITGTGVMDLLSEPLKEILEHVGHLGDGIPVPPLIQMWMCYTNKGGAAANFDDQWFESFVKSVGRPIAAHRLKNYPVSKGIAEHFIMKQDREMEYPFVKRSRVSMNVPDNFPEVYTDRMYQIMGVIGTWGGQHLVSQQQIYAGGEVSKNGKDGVTSYSWREQALAMSHDSFYNVGFFRDARDKAEKWQNMNDDAFIGQKAFADRDMRMFAYTFGERELEKVWQCFYDSEEKYLRLKKIKKDLDPNGVFTCDAFSLGWDGKGK